MSAKQSDSEDQISTSSNQGKILSRNALYTSLSAYKQSDVSPETYMVENAASFRNESTALANFLHQVSYSYHRKEAGVSDAKGSRPILAKEMEAYLKTKAITLVKDVTASMTTSSSAKQKKMERKAFRPRKRPRSEDWMKMKKTPSLVSGPQDSVSVEEFLCRLTGAWVDYAKKLLNVTHPKSSPTVIHDRFVKLRSQVELIGAPVLLSECPARRHWKNRRGVYVGETKNTWKVFLQKDKAVQLVSVPKRDSVVTLLIPLESRNEDAGKGAFLPHRKAKTVQISLDGNRCADGVG